MNFLKRILLIISLFLVLIGVVSLFLPSKFLLERSILINADNQQIFNQVEDFKNWINWSPWASKDESIYLNQEGYSNPSNGVGANFVWESKHEDVGSGNIEIVEIIPNQSIKTITDLDFTQLSDVWSFNETNEGVKVVWATQLDFGFNPVSKFFGLFMEDQIAPDFELGLKQLKEYTENLPKIHQVEVVQDSVQTTWFLSIRDSVSQSEMNNIHGKIYSQINHYMDNNELEIASSPMVIYHYWSDTLIDIEAGIPITDSVEVIDKNIRLNKIRSGKVVTAIHHGAYDRIPETYFGINEWMRKNKVVVNGPPWEVYITDPAKEVDPEKWQTAIYFPIN